jgi:signal transduction histidine kinase
VPELVASVRDAGVPVEYLVEGVRRELPPGVDVAVHRLVQEALTNVLRHARGASATVVLRYTDAGVEVAVHDDGQSADAGPGLGYGLIGMRERVSVYGGTLEAGPRAGGGFVVAAAIPVGPALADPA